MHNFKFCLRLLGRRVGLRRVQDIIIITFRHAQAHAHRQARGNIFRFISAHNVSFSRFFAISFFFLLKSPQMCVCIFLY